MHPPWGGKELQWTINKLIFFRPRGHRGIDLSYKKTKQITPVTRKQIILREPLQIQTLQREKYLKWINELQSGDGCILHILANCEVIHHTMTYLKIILPTIIPIHLIYSPTYPSVEPDDMHQY